MVKCLFAAGIVFTSFHFRNQQNTQFAKPLNTVIDWNACVKGREKT